MKLNQYYNYYFFIKLKGKLDEIIVKINEHISLIESDSNLFKLTSTKNLNFFKYKLNLIRSTIQENSIKTISDEKKLSFSNNNDDDKIDIKLKINT